MQKLSYNTLKRNMIQGLLDSLPSTSTHYLTSSPHSSSIIHLITSATCRSIILSLLISLLFANFQTLSSCGLLLLILLLLWLRTLLLATSSLIIRILAHLWSSSSTSLLVDYYCFTTTTSDNILLKHSSLLLIITHRVHALAFLNCVWSFTHWQRFIDLLI